MQIILYNTASENNKINKDISTVILSVDGTLKNECAVSNPTIRLQATADILNANYAYIPIFKRYYFINKITSLVNGLWLIDLSCDVLMSFKDSILALECVVNRASSDYNSYFNDSEFSCYNNSRVQTKLFPNYGVFNNGRTYLITVSGKGAE